ncbi:MAG: signal peptide peptidase SppA [Spirochaetes bacterium]|nr:signal peptide peptidase SppA [Spirochaetota bacterium]
MILQLSVSKFIKKFLICTLFFIFILHSKNHIALAENTNPYFSVMPSLSASHTNSVFAPLINPVFSDIAPSPSVSYIMQQFECTDSGNHFLLANIAGFIFSYSWLNSLYNCRSNAVESADTSLFTLGKGFLFGNIFGIGLNYSFSKSNNDYDDYSSFTPGILLRPFRFLSLGYVARDINSPEFNGSKIQGSNVFSVSIRPADFLTLSVDAVKYKTRKFDYSDMLYSVDMRLFYGISVFANINTDKDISFGFSMPFGIPGSRYLTATADAYAKINNSSLPDSAYFGMTIAQGKAELSPAAHKNLLRITLNDTISELKIESIFGSDRIIFYDILHAIERASNDSSIAGLILQIDDTGLGFAQIQELRDQIKLFREKNKRTHAILNSSGNMEYYLASSCKEIYFSPVNVFSITGLKAEVYFVKKGLEKIGIKFESVKKGIYKSYPETFVREHMSPEFRENMISILSDLNDQFLNDISNDRQMPKETIDSLLESGFFKPEAALSAGFIDHIAYPGEAENEIREKNLTLISMIDYKKQQVKSDTWGLYPEIAVVYVKGSITRGKSRGYRDILPADTGDLTYLEALNTAFKDSNIKAVIIRIDSGGGSAAASELMWHYLMQLKAKFKKPVVFSFGNMAASGGYYIACTGDKIISEKGSITGSIGVVAGKISLQEFYNKLGINKDIIKMSEFADIFNEAKNFSAKERAVVMQGVDYTYNRFTDKVSAGRGIDKKDMDKVAQGKVFTGNQAKRNGLIDSFGGLLTAVKLAVKNADIKKEFKIRHLPEISAPLLNILGLNDESRLKAGLKRYLQFFDFIDFKNEYTFYYFPYRIMIK